KEIGSIAEGAFCPECGNPVHTQCRGEAGPAEGRCPTCCGDPANTGATPVREERLRQAPRPRPAIVRSAHGQDGKAKKTPFKRYRNLLALAGIIVAAFVSVWLRREPWPDLPGEMARVEQVRDEAERATRDYQPAKAIRLDGPDTDTAAL